jgi:hypothetical protein
MPIYLVQVISCDNRNADDVKLSLYKQANNKQLQDTNKISDTW